MQNPFTTTFSKAPKTYIAKDEVFDILENFRYDMPSESVYKITGVRGSGKTVVLAKIIEEYKKTENLEKGWLVYQLSPNRDMLQQMAAMLYKEGFIDKKKVKTGLNVNATVLGTGGGFGYTSSESEKFFDIGVEIEEMLKIAQSLGKKIMIAIDEVSRNQEMVVFASEFGKWLSSSYPVYLVCTGLYENIEELSNVKNLTFFRRATTKEAEPLNRVRMTETYKRKLDINTESAKELADITKGYAYAFQELGILCFERGIDDKENIIADLKSELFAYSYEKIWEELTQGDRNFLNIFSDKDRCSREESLRILGNKSGNYSVYRDRLIKRGLIKAERGQVELALPYFGEYLREYHIG